MLKLRGLWNEMCLKKHCVGGDTQYLASCIEFRDSNFSHYLLNTPHINEEFELQCGL